MSLELRKFNMREITFKKEENKGPVIVMIGRRDTGKSFLVRDLLFYHQDIPIGTVMSGKQYYCNKRGTGAHVFTECNGNINSSFISQNMWKHGECEELW